MEQNLINYLIGAVSLLFGWVLRVVWGAVKDLQAADIKLSEKVNKIEVLVAGEYVTREEFGKSVDRLMAKLDSIENKLDQKADK